MSKCCPHAPCLGSPVTSARSQIPYCLCPDTGSTARTWPPKHMMYRSRWGQRVSWLRKRGSESEEGLWVPGWGRWMRPDLSQECVCLSRNIPSQKLVPSGLPTSHTHISLYLLCSHWLPALPPPRSGRSPKRATESISPRIRVPHLEIACWDHTLSNPSNLRDTGDYLTR